MESNRIEEAAIKMQDQNDPALKLTSLPTDILRYLFQTLQTKRMEDRSTAVLLALTCKRLYFIHWDLNGATLLHRDDEYLRDSLYAWMWQATGYAYCRKYLIFRPAATAWQSWPTKWHWMPSGGKGEFVLQPTETKDRHESNRDGLYAKALERKVKQDEWMLGMERPSTRELAKFDDAYGMTTDLRLPRRLDPEWMGRVMEAGRRRMAPVDWDWMGELTRAGHWPPKRCFCVCCGLLEGAHS
jgi:hypothetical protein